MIYPKGIIDFVLSDTTLRERFAKDIEGRSLNVSTKVSVASSDFERWMFEEGHYQSNEIKRYLYFIATLKEIFNNIFSFFNRINKKSINKKDRFNFYTTPEEMLYIARSLYYLDSYGVRGDILECGCFKGFSSCCLSWAANFLGKKLIIADSFQGIPQNGEGYDRDIYKKHQYKGEIDEVEENIRTLGKIENVEFIAGWYHESLVGFNHPLCLIWMDVTLYQSVLDVLNNVYNNLMSGGVIFSHQLEEIQLKKGIIQDRERNDVLKAISDFFKRRKIPYKAKYMISRMGIIVPNTEEEILLSRDKQELLLELIDPKEKILHENQLIADETLLVVERFKRIPLLTPMIKYLANNFLRRRE